MARNLYVFSKKNYPDYPDISAESIIISSLHHDLCKVNFYGKEKAWVKHEFKWLEYDTYKAGKEDKLPLGHGEKSVILMLKNGFLDLSDQEMLAIRHHMGSFGGDINTDIAMKDSLVKLIHMADMCAGMVELTVDYKEQAIQEYLKTNR